MRSPLGLLVKPNPKSQTANPTNQNAVTRLNLTEDAQHIIMECPICLQRFDDKSVKPLLPSCGHAVCQGCLRGLLANRGHRPSCPSCRHPFTGDEHFTLDYTVISGNSLIPLEGERCDEIRCSNVASHYCEQCNLYYCGACTEKHELHPSTVCHRRSMEVKQTVEKSLKRLSDVRSRKEKLAANVIKMKQSIHQNYSTSQNEITTVFAGMISQLEQDQEKLQENLVLEYQRSMANISNIEDSINNNCTINENEVEEVVSVVLQNKYKYSPEIEERLNSKAAMIDQEVLAYEVMLNRTNIAIPLKTMIGDSESKIKQRLRRTTALSIKETVTYEPLSPN